MEFDARRYGSEVEALLGYAENGQRLMPLVVGTPVAAEAIARLRRAKPDTLFPRSFSPEGALAGLWLYFECFDESHRVAQDVQSPEGSYWHAILHRVEPDPGNAGYWFRRVGQHPIYPQLTAVAEEVMDRYPGVQGFVPSPAWNPFAFVEFCSTAARRGNHAEQAAREIQRAEWQLLFDWCAREA